VMNYNTQLCNTAWRKKLLARVTQCTCFCAKTVTVIFLGALARSGNRSVKRSLHRERKKNVLFTVNVIREIKPTKT